MIRQCLTIAKLIMLLIAVANIDIFQHAAAEENFKYSTGYWETVKPKKYIIDVDAGADDAVALLLALAQEDSERELLAITCTHGNTNVEQVVINVLKTLRVANKKIPVYMGSHDSILITPYKSNFGDDGFGDVPDANPPSLDEKAAGHAVLEMIKLVKQYPNEITIVALGPLTNIALAVKLDPDFRKNIKYLFWMGGSVRGLGNIKPGIEFNAYMDPEANFVVFNTTGNPVIMLSWEVCTVDGFVRSEWRMKELGKLNSPYIKFLNKIEAHTLNSSFEWAACDAKMMAIVLDPSIAIRVSYHHLTAITQSIEARGITLVDYIDETGMPKNVILIEGSIKRVTIFNDYGVWNYAVFRQSERQALQ